MHYANTVVELIGRTPLLKLHRVSEMSEALVLGKCEFMNPSGSVKDRIGYNMIKKSLEEKRIDLSSTIVEPTSGNTGIALASVCASYGLKLILTMPSSMSIERQKLLKALGATLELTPAEKGMRGAVDRALEIVNSTPNSYMPNQFENPSNPEIHMLTTAEEIWSDLKGNIDIFIAAVGTGGTVSGVGKVLKEKNKNIKVIAVEPQESPVLSGGNPSPHKIQGIGAGFVPRVYDSSSVDEVLQVSYAEAVQASRKMAKEEGVLVGISAGANVHAAKTVACRTGNKGKTIVTVLCDTGERYLSTELYGG